MPGQLDQLLVDVAAQEPPACRQKTETDRLDLWFNETSPIANETFLPGYGGFGNINQAYEILTVNHDLQDAVVVALSQWEGQINGPTIQDGQWNNLGVTNTGYLATLFLNGTMVATGTLTISTPSDTTFYIGTIGNVYDDEKKMNGLI